MKKEIVLPEESLALKELGFDETCIGYYHGGNPIKFSFTDKIKNSKCLARVKRDNKNAHTVYLCTAPTYSQAFNWFREKHNLHAEPVWDIIEGELVWFFSITEIGNLIDDAIDLLYSKTYEEAELACLRQLIEIVKRK